MLFIGSLVILTLLKLKNESNNTNKKIKTEKPEIYEPHEAILLKI